MHDSKQFTRLGQPQGNTKRGFSDVFRDISHPVSDGTSTGDNEMLEKVTIYHVNGDVAQVVNVDANEAVRNHPQEWSKQPWTAAQRKAVEDAAKAAE